MADTLKKGTRVTGVDRSKLATTLGKRYDSGESIRSLAASTGRSYGFVHRILTETVLLRRGDRGLRGHRRHAHVPKPLTSGARADGRFGKQDFIYRCRPGRVPLSRWELLRHHMTTVEKGLTLHRYWDRSSCASLRPEAGDAPPLTNDE